MTIDWDDLRDKARAAHTENPDWYEKRRLQWVVAHTFSQIKPVEAAFMATASPALILKLIEELERLQSK